MNKYILDFEKPIADLEMQLNDIIDNKDHSAINSEEQINNLKLKIKNLKQKVFSNLTSWQKVQLSRHPERPYTLDYINSIFEDFVELHGDRCSGDDKAMVCGIAQIEGQSVAIIGHQKGRTIEERKYRNFGMANPQGYRKALRIMRLAEKFKKPIISFIDTPGAYPGIEAEEFGQAQAIANNLKNMFEIKVPIITIIIGEGASGGALGIGIADIVLMLENSWYSVISPESCSTILWKQGWKHKEIAADMLKLTAEDMLKNKLIDGIIKEPLGGAHKDPKKMFSQVKLSILENLQILKEKDIEDLLNNRFEKFTNIGKEMYESSTQNV